MLFKFYLDISNTAQGSNGSFLHLFDKEAKLPTVKTPSSRLLWISVEAFKLGIYFKQGFNFAELLLLVVSECQKILAGQDVLPDVPWQCLQSPKGALQEEGTSSPG